MVSILPRIDLRSRCMAFFSSAVSAALVRAVRMRRDRRFGRSAWIHRSSMRRSRQIPGTYSHGCTSCSLCPARPSKIETRTKNQRTTTKAILPVGQSSRRVRFFWRRSSLSLTPASMVMSAPCHALGRNTERVSLDVARLLQAPASRGLINKMPMSLPSLTIAHCKTFLDPEPD